MSRKMKIVVSALVLVLLLTAGGAAVVLADEGEEPAPVLQTGENGLLARVAAILDIPEEDLADAFEQAREEMWQERHGEARDEALARAVAEGLLTEEEAGEIKEWWEQRPKALGPGLLQRACGLLGSRIRNVESNGWGQGAMNQQRWLGSRADSASELPLRARFFKAMRGWQMAAVQVE